MWRPSEDGGAFAECFFAQYPLGMGRKPLPPFITAAAAERRVQFTAGNAAAPEEVRTAQTTVPGGVVVVSMTEARGDDGAGRLTQTTEKTREALETALQNRQAQEEDFSGRNIRRNARKRPLLEIALPGDVGATGMHDPAPIVRSPTRTTKGANEGADGSTGSSSSTTVVPFSIGNWKNKRKLVIPLDQRLAQQAETDAVSSGSGISDHVMQLAVAMQKARREVEAEQANREKAQQEEEERRQAEREAEATQQAREMLEKAAANMLQSSAQRKKETREERLERIRLERGLREREKEQEVRQRRLARAATRLGMSVEALEADEMLLKTVDDTAAGQGLCGVAGRYIQPPMSSSATPASAEAGVKQDGTSTERLPSLYADDEDEGRRRAGGIRKGVFGSAVISNEGIRREMEALGKMEEQRPETKDGLRLGEERDRSSDEDDDDGGGLGMAQLMKKKRRM
ncbi:SNW domain-containing protein 1 [Trypanosoma grayi]|uniref:SNW domain-containing protein 1 n=1 Tax=Trypanosoma grayi TaxID=71804 RepID=UPI0004F40BED|nr:SNW domain-containing protein 1 [Trypanosoma grayi]KEG08273.1 SNW domain-containing protein 1 [Trypanosoma grayi]